MLEKIQRLQNHPYVRQFKDIRVVGFLVFGVLVLLVSYSGVNVIQSNFELEKQVARLQQENTLAELENNNIRFKNEYFESDQYLELMARKNYGKGLPGETLLLVPKNVALSYTIPATSATKSDTAGTKKPWYQRNLEAWRNFFSHQPIESI